MSTTPITSSGRKGDIVITFGPIKIPEHPLPTIGIHLHLRYSKSKVVTIAAEHMHMFDIRDVHPNGQPKCMELCHQISTNLYGFRSNGGAHRVMDAIYEWMSDVKNLAPPDCVSGSSILAPDFFDQMKSRGYESAEFVGG